MSGPLATPVKATLAGGRVTLREGDCLKFLRRLPDNSVHSIVTDPPYGLSKEPDMLEVLRHWLSGDDYQHRGGGFMGKSWDSFVPGPAIWRECLRILVPGGHMAVFGGTRTFDLLVTAIRIGGFEIRDQLAWIYGSGWPKGSNLGKKEPEWDGWNTALKPAFEPICLARKPLAEVTVVENMVVHGAGAINVDACRIATDDKLGGGNTSELVDRQNKNEGWKRPWMNDDDALVAAAERSRASVARSEALGRYPANMLHDGSPEAIAGFPQTGKSSGHVRISAGSQSTWKGYDRPHVTSGHIDAGGSAARYFYSAKASKYDRGDSEHPTIKPINLMRWLTRLVTRPGGIVVDPFSGSGTTALAAHLEGFYAIAFEQDPQYCRDIVKRFEALEAA